LDDDGDLRLDEISAVSVTAAVDAASPVTQLNWIPFSDDSHKLRKTAHFAVHIF